MSYGRSSSKLTYNDGSISLLYTDGDTCPTNNNLKFFLFLLNSRAKWWNYIKFNKIKAIGEGVSHVFNKLILFKKIFTKLQVALYRFKEFILFFEIWPVKVGPHNRYLMERKNKNKKKSLFHLKSISSFIFQAILLKFSGNVPYL